MAKYQQFYQQKNVLALETLVKLINKTMLKRMKIDCGQPSKTKNILKFDEYPFSQGKSIIWIRITME